MDLASCHPSGVWGLEVAVRFLENLWISEPHDAVCPEGGLRCVDCVLGFHVHTFKQGNADKLRTSEFSEFKLELEVLM